MSRANISDMTPLPSGGGAVTFQLRRGGSRTYFYDAPDFAAIMGGADPKDFDGSDTPITGNAAASGEVASFEDAILDIGELL